MSLDERDHYVLAQCMWWIDKGPALPPEPAVRDALWISESGEWLRTAEELLRYLRYNGLDVVRPEAASLHSDRAAA